MISSSSSLSTQKTQKKEKPRFSTQKLAHRPSHRLRSIHRDAQILHSTQFRELLAFQIHPVAATHWPILPNERCGSWYYVGPNNLVPITSTTTTTTTIPSLSCYFKSTDGHCDTWNFSLKRLNLHVLDVIVASAASSSTSEGGGGGQEGITSSTITGGCILIDSSVKKWLPDSFTRTIPIWACVLNRLALLYRTEALLGHYSLPQQQQQQQPTKDFLFWDTQLYTPELLVSTDEHATLSNVRIEEHVQALYKSRAIVNPQQFLECMKKPLRPCWVTTTTTTTTIANSSTTSSSPNTGAMELLEPSPRTSVHTDQYFWLVCVNPSTYHHWNKETKKNQIVWQPNEDVSCTTASAPTKSTNHDNSKSARGFYYTPGAADDEESWARGLTPELFWQHESELLEPCSIMDPLEYDHFVDQRIDEIVSNAKKKQMEENSWATFQDDIGLVTGSSSTILMDRIGNLSLWIGSRRSGRPPHCWNNLDAILNVTDQEYNNMMEGSGLENNINKHKFYLQLSVAEGKRDRTELERWMTVGLVFLITHLQQGRRVLVHCNQGKDRSVAMVIAFLCVACPLTFPLHLEPEFESWRLQDIICIQSSIQDNRENTADTTDRNEQQYYRHSGLLKSLVELLLENEGGGNELFLEWIHIQKHHIPISEPLANKEQLRIALHLIRQDRSIAEPSRSTMQKLNRFFMSSPIYRGAQKEN